jgi:hypothetical protein
VLHPYRSWFSGKIDKAIFVPRISRGSPPAPVRMELDPEKRVPVFRTDHARPKRFSRKTFGYPALELAQTTLCQWSGIPRQTKHRLGLRIDASTFREDCWHVSGRMPGTQRQHRRAKKFLGRQ